jgi:hypothetical protein
MRKLSLNALLIVAITAGAMSCSSSKHTVKRMTPGAWQAQPINIDGSNKDWPSPYPEYDDKAMLGYAVSNDKDNIYITVETGDPATQLKILREGLTVWIDKTGNKDEVMAINYPIPMPPVKKDNNSQDANRAQPAHMQQGQNSSQPDKRRMDLEDKVRRLMSEAKEYSLQGFKSCNLQYPIPENDSCGIVVRLGLDADNEMVWEAVIPFKTFYNKAQITRADRGRAISVCFETTGEKKPAGQPAGNRGSSGGGMRPSLGIGGMGGMGMRMGGGHGGGNRGGQTPADNMMESLYKSTKTYKKFGLAFQEEGK